MACGHQVLAHLLNSYKNLSIQEKILSGILGVQRQFLKLGKKIHFQISLKKSTMQLDAQKIIFSSHRKNVPKNIINVVHPLFQTSVYLIGWLDDVIMNKVI